MRMIRIGWIKYLILNFFALSIFIIDRIFKIFFIKNPSQRLGSDFFYNVLSFHLEENQGIAFGILFNKTFLLILVILVIFILFGFLFKSYSKKNILEIFSLTLVIIGAISNLIDRLLFGFVIDYIDVSFFTVFNLADCMITFGVLILAYEILKRKKTSG